ncbi:MAG: aldo/keto reductase [SAR324 cluster bacterium]|nr:aldo/keto reductase [SAR324 cluster bacterium]
MEYRKLGQSGLKVSPLCLGAMMLKGQTDEATSKRIIDKAREFGVNFIDTADAYNAGRSEEIIGQALRQDRDWWVLATKLANPLGEGPNQQGLNRKWVMEAVEHSLKRLGTDYIDIYYLHKEDPDTPLEETVSAIGDLIRQGKIRYFGLSNFRAWRLAEVVRLCEQLGVNKPVVSQPYYNAMNRMPEVEHLPACRHYGLGVFPYSPLARGVLTGKYSTDMKASEGTRAARRDERMMQTEWRYESLVIAQKLKKHAESRGITAGQFAVCWVLNNQLVTGTIAGPRTEAQWEEYLGALDYPFSIEDERLVDDLVAPGHPSTPGFNDPAYPLEGRISRI